MHTQTLNNKLFLNDFKSLYKNYYTNGFKYILDDMLLFNTSNKKINIIIGIKGRESYLYTTINYLKYSIKNSSNPDYYNIIICEHDSQPTYKSFCAENKIDYGFIDLNKYNTNNLYSRGLVFNFAVKCFPQSEWYLLHDCDLLPSKLFFKNLENKIDTCKTWIQPYSNKMVLNLSSEDTNLLQITKDKCIYDLDEIFFLKISRNLPGAVGGSILVPKKLFYDVGGFDNELFYGYAPEDALFWFKLECLFQKIEHHTHWYNHFGSAEYCDENNLYHQSHPLELKNNPESTKMTDMINDYVNLNYQEITELINFKKELFKNA
jgi:hypothetical protein